MDFVGLIKDFMEQIKWGYLLVVVIVMAICAWKRAVIGSIISILGLGLVGIFIFWPTEMQQVAGWIKDRIIQ